MKERPILFSAAMVLALLNGTKTQTRRIAPISDLNIKPHSDDLVTWSVRFTRPVKGVIGNHSGGKLSDLQARSIIAAQFNPFGQPGDRLWVKENWRIGAWRENDGSLAIDYLASEPAKTPWITVPEDAENYHGSSIFENYWIQSTDDCIESDLSTDDDGRYHWEPGQSPCRKRPSIYMPRWASRITLEIIDVRVERLQDISEEDAIAEGVTWFSSGAVECPGMPETPIDAYRALWEKINGPGSWEKNPWVWCISFKRTGP
jgi:hypothetical protein